MGGPGGEGPGRGTAGDSSRAASGGDTQRWVIVLLLLTATVAVFAVRITRDTGYSRVEVLIKEGIRLYRAAGEEPAPLSPSEVEERVREWTGAKLELPREDDLFSVRSVRRERIDRRSAAALRIEWSGNDYLLLVVRPRPAGGSGDPGGLFSEPGFLSGEKEGTSFVYWEREGASFFLVTAADLTSAIDLVRRYFT